MPGSLPRCVAFTAAGLPPRDSSPARLCHDKGAIQNFTAGLAQPLRGEGDPSQRGGAGPLWISLIPSTTPPEKVAFWRAGSGNNRGENADQVPRSKCINGKAPISSWNLSSSNPVVILDLSHSIGSLLGDGMRAIQLRRDRTAL